MKEYLRFLYRCFRVSFVGDWRYQLWMLLLTIFVLLGVNAWARQFVHGLITTGMTDQVSWGLFIANFTYLVGMAAAAVMLVIPVYIYRNKELHDLVIFGELFAVAAIIMCLLFVVVDLGRPDRMQHMLMRFNFPMSLLTWDVVVLNVYLLLNLHICGYLIYSRYRKREPGKWFYIPFVFIAIVWAISIHTVTAFLLVGLGGRPYWNTAIIAPRFLASAFSAGPAFIILTLMAIQWFTSHQVPQKAYMTLRAIVVVAMSINVFLLGSELFTEFYSDSAHIASVKYLWFGIHGHDELVPWIWTALAMNLVALVMLYLPITRSRKLLAPACILLIVGIWIEKGMGLIVPAFVPSPIGEIVEYTPTLNEILICVGIWSFGLLIYTIFIRVTLPVLSGQLVADRIFHTTPNAAEEFAAANNGQSTQEVLS
ncbi:MAG: polysulfide reductase NrfD [Phycisphaerales bacterium]|jgi:molybdopterin-containing oxidoreductase family membrane subunit|nr:polysulfide reductase NrfD [Phycisphaerales bacterium]